MLVWDSRLNYFKDLDREQTLYIINGQLNKFQIHYCAILVKNTYKDTERLSCEFPSRKIKLNKFLNSLTLIHFKRFS